MNPAAAAHRNLRSSNTPGRHRAAGDAVHSYGFGKVGVTWKFPNIVNVTRRVLTLEVDQVNHAIPIHCDLRLDAAIRSSDNFHFCPVFTRAWDSCRYKHRHSNKDERHPKCYKLHL